MPKPIKELTARWYYYFDNFQFSPKDFYAIVEEHIKKRKVPKANLSRVKFYQDLGFWNKREYLRVKNQDYIFDICASPYGGGFFVSYWVGYPTSAFINFLLQIPILGAVVYAFTVKRTYYQLDLATMFQETIRKSIASAINEIAEEKGFRPPTAEEYKPMDAPKRVERR